MEEHAQRNDRVDRWNSILLSLLGEESEERWERKTNGMTEKK